MAAHGAGAHRKPWAQQNHVMTSPSPIDLKGSLFTLSVLKLLDSNLNNCIQALSDKIAQAPRFFEGAPLVVDITALAGGNLDFAALRQQIQQLGLVPVAITGASNGQREAARANGWSLLTGSGNSRSSTAAPERDAATPTSNTPSSSKEPAQGASPTLVYEGQVRSGQQIYAKDGDLVIIGSVGNGAEVIADGSIHIYGTLRGRAIAGAKGDTEARIFCHNLQPELVAICGTYWLSSAMQAHWKQNGVIRLDGETLAFKALA
jgi:septum site-determining protein MinC